MKSPLFRKEALDKLSSPEKLHETMQAVTLKHWVILTVLATLVASAFLWGMVGQLPFQVAGTGILIKGDGIVEIESLTAGEITHVFVKPGDTVTAGQRLGTMKVEYTENQLELAEDSLKNTQQRHVLLINSYQSLYDEKERTFSEKEGMIKRRMAQSQNQLKRLTEVLTTKESLHQQGIYTTEALMPAQKDMAEAQEIQRQLQNDWDQLGIDREQARQDYLHQKTQLQSELSHAQLLQQQLVSQKAFEEELISRQDGVITEVKARPGSSVHANTPLFSLEPHQKNRPLELILYIPARDGKRVAPGMPVNISPSTAKREEYGYLKGKVSFVSLYPASKSAMMHHIHNESLVHSLTLDEPVLQVTARLIDDPNTRSGYAWTSKKGPAYPVESGTLCQANVVVESHHPLHYLLPYAKKHLGL